MSEEISPTHADKGLDELRHEYWVQLHMYIPARNDRHMSVATHKIVRQVRGYPWLCQFRNLVDNDLGINTAISATIIQYLVSVIHQNTIYGILATFSQLWLHNPKVDASS